MARKIPVPNTFQPIDDAVDEAWESLRKSEVANRVFYSASEAANFSMIWHGLSITKAVITRDPAQAIRTSAALGIESALVNGPIKSLFERDRPDVEPHQRPRQLRQPKTSSFPSGHASAAVVASSFLTRGMGPLWSWPIRVLAAVVATSRIHVQIHHATDVAAGAATGWALNKMLRPVLGRLLS